MAVKAPLTGSMVEFANPPQNMEVIKYTFWSRKLVAISIAGAWPSEIPFFTDQVGVAGATGRDTNLSKPNTLASNPNKFLGQFLNCTAYNTVAAIAVVASLITDINQVVMQTYLRLELMSKEYLTVPTYHVPAGGGTWQPGLFTGAIGSATNGVPMHRNCYAVELPFERETTLTLKMLCTAGAGTYAIVTTNALHVEVAITGLLMRPKQ